MRVSTGGDFSTVGTFSDWTSYGRTKGVVETVRVTVPGGSSASATICVAQPGANGNGARSACAVVQLAPACDGVSGGDLI